MDGFSTDNRIHAVYELNGVEEPVQAARALAVEETIEYPPELVADEWIRDEVIGRVENVSPTGKGQHTAHVSYTTDAVGGELPQLLSMLFGNCSMWPGVRLVDVAFPRELLDRFPGPRFGVAGVRQLTGAADRPLLATAIKPLGSSPEILAGMAYELAAGGVDVIKDDQGLANQPYARYEERVARVATAVRKANEKYGTRAIYAPCINGPTEEIDRRIGYAVAEGATGAMVLPGVTGFDVVRYLAARDDVDVPLLTHCSMLGAFIASRDHGIAPWLIYGTFPRLAGADLTIYPHAGGRFNFALDDCGAIAAACASELGGFPSILPAPGGGMTRPRIGELCAFYGPDVALLIGGDLHRGDLRSNAEQFRALAESAFSEAVG